jgi:arsenite methyltransferase
VRESMPLWTGCVAGALKEQEFIDLLKEVGFENPSVEPTRAYTRDDAAALLVGTGLDSALADQVEGKVMSGFVRATKPGAPAARSQKPLRPLASLGAKEATRDCGCDDGCCR